MRTTLWKLIGHPLFRMTPHPWYGTRRILVRWFGMTLSPTTKLRRTVRIDQPWNVSAGALTVIGDDAVLRARCPISIGARCVISQYAILTTEALDPDRPLGEPRTAPISIDDDCWIATDTLVMPGSHVAEGTVVGSRAVVEGDLPPWQIAMGQPAVIRARRVLHETTGG